MGLLVLNAGSATLKAAWFDVPDAPATWRAQVDLGSGTLHVDGAPTRATAAPPLDIDRALARVFDALGASAPRTPATVVHRIVHGGSRFTGPVVVDAAVRSALADLAPLAPLHQPANLAGLDAARVRWPQARHVACFDTAFHARWPDAARRFALPRALHDAGLRRYGFHGLAHAFAARALLASLPAAGRAVVAHLGGGASLCALRDFASIDCSMGYSALDGLPMGTRCGALDPGVVIDLLLRRGYTAERVERLLYRESGLLGISGSSGDLRELLAAGTIESREAIELFVHHVVRGIGAMAASLGGLDALAFSGGIGEHSATIRAAVCRRLGFLGLAIDPAANEGHAAVLEAAGSAVAVRIVACDEESWMAGEAGALLAGPAAG